MRSRIFSTSAFIWVSSYLCNCSAVRLRSTVFEDGLDSTLVSKKTAATGTVAATTTTTTYPLGTADGAWEKECVFPTCPAELDWKHWDEYSPGDPSSENYKPQNCYCREQHNSVWMEVARSMEKDFFLVNVYKQNHDQTKPVAMNWAEALDAFQHSADFMHLHKRMAGLFPYKLAYWENKCFDIANPAATLYQVVWGRGTFDADGNNLEERDVSKGSLEHMINDAGNWSNAQPSRSGRRMLVVAGHRPEVKLDVYRYINSFLKDGPEDQQLNFFQTLGATVQNQVNRGSGHLMKHHHPDQEWSSVCVMTRSWITPWIHASVIETSDLYMYFDWQCDKDLPGDGFCYD